MRKKPPISPDGLALILSLAAQRFPLVCPICHRAVQDIQRHGSWLTRLPCGHQLTLCLDDSSAAGDQEDG